MSAAELTFGDFVMQRSATTSSLVAQMSSRPTESSAVQTRLNADPTDPVPVAAAQVSTLLETKKYLAASDLVLNFALDALESNEINHLDRFMEALSSQLDSVSAYETARGQAQIINILGVTFSSRQKFSSRETLRDGFHRLIVRTDGEEMARKLLANL